MKMRMKMLVVTAGLLAVPGFASAAAQDPGMEEPGMHQPSDRSATSPRSSGMENAQVFQKAKNFKVEGTITSVDPTSGTMTLQRENLPPAELKIASDTKIEMDGKTASIQDLQPGSEVRAEFNLTENQPIAVSVDAKESKSQKKQQRSQPQRSPSGGSSY